MHRPLILVLLGLLAAASIAFAAPNASIRWTPEERRLIFSLSISALEDPPRDPSNRFSDDPRAVALGRDLFFDAALSSNGKVACATCHDPGRQFQDGVPLARGVAQTNRRTMPLAGTNHAPFLFWDGRKDSLWSQALGPLESAVEHGGDRTAYAHHVAKTYRDAYEAAFGPLPKLEHLPLHAGPVADPESAARWNALSQSDQETVTSVFVNIGKTIAAYERSLPIPKSRFDVFANALSANEFAAALSDDEAAGLRLFIGKAQCVTCHNGPLFSDGHFHNIGIAPTASAENDLGRSAGIALLKADPFNCLGKWSDASGDCPELEFLADASGETLRAYKTPSLRGVATRAPYMHAGQLATLEDVIDHYDRAKPAAAGHSELVRLNLTKAEKRQLVAFLKALD